MRASLWLASVLLASLSSSLLAEEIKSERGYIVDIEERTLSNTNFREVLFSGNHTQLVVMSIEPGTDIGEEVHKGIDQFIRVEKGEAQVVLNGKQHRLKADDIVIIPAGVRHNVINTSTSEDLKLYSLYSPPEHKPGTIHKTKAEAAAAHEHE